MQLCWIWDPWLMVWFSFGTLIIPSLRPPVPTTPNEKSAVNLTVTPWYNQSHISFAAFKIFSLSLSFNTFYYDGPGMNFVVTLLGSLLCFLDVYIVFYQIWEVFSHYVFSYFSAPFSLFSSSTCVMCILVCLMVSHISLGLCSSSSSPHFLHNLYHSTFKFSDPILC